MPLRHNPKQRTLPVSVLIVNYNGANHIGRCLDALKLQSFPRHHFEVIVVDNASHDDSVQQIRSKYNWVQLIALAKNTGFAEGNNVAARAAHGRTLVLLNHDTIPDPHWLAELMRVTDRSPSRMAVSKLVFAHDPTTVQSAGLQLLRDGRGADRGFRQQDVGQFEREEPVFAGCGAAISIPAPLEDHALFDSRYFLYYEDCELGWRLRLRGHGPVYAPRSLVLHVHGAAAGDQSAIFHFHVERNRALTALRHGDPVCALFTALVLICKCVLASLRSPGHARTLWRALGSYTLLAPRFLAQRWQLVNSPRLHQLRKTP